MSSAPNRGSPAPTRRERSTYTVALCIALTAYGNSLISAHQLPGQYPPAFQMAALVGLGVALAIGAVEVVFRRAPRVGVWAFTGLSVAIAAVHPLAYRGAGTPDYPPLFHAVSMGFMAMAVVGNRTMTALADLAFVPWSFAIRVDGVGMALALLEGVLWAIQFPMVYVGSQLVGRAIADAEARAEVLATARHDELRAAQRAFEQERWNGLIHDKILGCLRLCFRQPTDSTITSAARDLAAEAASILAESHPETDDLPIKNQLEAICERLSLKARIDIHESDANPMVASAFVSASESALSNVALHAETSEVNIWGHVFADHAHVDITDNGKGFTTESVDARRIGVSHGIVRRIHSVGGVAVVTSAPGAGTQIQLSWHLASPKATVLAWRQRIFLIMIIFGSLTLLAQLGIGVLFLSRFDPLWVQIVALVLTPCAAYALVLLPMGRLWGAVVGLTIAIPCSLTVALTAPVPDDMPLWFIGVSAPAIAVMSFRYRAWLGPAVVCLQFVVMVLVFWVRGDTPWLVLVTSFMSLALTAVAVAGARIALDWESRRIMLDHDAQTAMMTSLIAAEERRRESSRQIAALAADLPPLLELLTEPSTILTSDLQLSAALEN